MSHAQQDLERCSQIHQASNVQQQRQCCISFLKGSGEQVPVGDLAMQLRHAAPVTAANTVTCTRQQVASPRARQALELCSGTVLASHAGSNMQAGVTARHCRSTLVQGSSLLLDQAKGVIRGVDAVVAPATPLAVWRILACLVHLPEANSLQVPNQATWEPVDLMLAHVAWSCCTDAQQSSWGDCTSNVSPALVPAPASQACACCNLSGETSGGFTTHVPGSDEAAIFMISDASPPGNISISLGVVAMAQIAAGGLHAMLSDQLMQCTSASEEGQRSLCQ